MAASFQTDIINKSMHNSTRDLQLHTSIEDLTLEYKIKYERLIKLWQASSEASATAGKSMEAHENAYKCYVKELKKSIFEKDMKIYNLEAKCSELQSKYDDLEAKILKTEEDSKTIAQCLSSSKKSPEKNECSIAEKTQVIETPIVQSSMPVADVLSPLLLPETPCKVSKQKRFSMINETLDKAMPSDEEEKNAFLRGVILEQKELLDFYATITGFAAWKDKVDSSANDSQCSLDFFKMKPQMQSAQDMELQFIVDYDVDDIEYHPINIPSEVEESLEKIAPYMKDNLYFSSGNAPKLLWNLLEVLNP